MKETQGIIERVVRLNEHFQQLHVAVEGGAFGDLKPGNSLLARRLPERWDPYLREHWWPASISASALLIERPGSLRYEPGEVVSLLGLVGTPFRYRRNLRNVLLIADNTAPTPFSLSINALISNSISVTLVLSGKAADYPTQHLPKEVEVLHADADFNWSNRVMTVGWADQVFAVVSQDDEIGRLRRIWTVFRELRADIPKAYLFGVFQPVLPCGAGACSACMIPLKGDESCLVCLDGPAIDLATVNLGP